MDLWVVAAATGAGYLAKYLKNSAEEKEELSESSSQIRDQTQPSCRSARKKRPKFGDILLRRDEDVTNGIYEISDILTLTKLQRSVDQKSENADVWDYGESETNQLTRNRPLTSKRVHGLSIKEKIVKKGYIFSPPPSPSTPFAAPLMINRIVNGDTSDMFGDFVNGDDKFSLELKNELLGSHLSRQSGMVELPRTRKDHVGKRRPDIVGSDGTLLSHGPPNGMILFFVGITIGIISSIIANKRELDNMNAQLKQKENLVRDLHEEIEMKDRLTVKEISIGDEQSLESTNRSSDWELVFSSSKHDLEKSTKCGNEEFGDQTVDNPELMSKIEAELEAELEKLELKIVSSELEEMSEYVELDPGFEADVIQGGLKIHMAQPADINQSETDNNESRTSTNHIHSSNYVVSPWELSLRLHELIESRLEARIKELKQALKLSKKRHYMGLDNSEIGSLFTPETQIYTYDMEPPLDMNFSGEALDVYNEAY